MDLTKQYIKMSRKSVEIQANWKWIIGKCYYNIILNEVHICTDNNLSGHWDTTHKNSMWLPRQDELQVMLKDKIRHNHRNSMSYLKGYEHGVGQEGYIDRMLTVEFYKFIKLEEGYPHPQYDYIKQFDSMEQLWLAFVMKENYNKVWNNNEWITKEN